MKTTRFPIPAGQTFDALLRRFVPFLLLLFTSLFVVACASSDEAADSDVLSETSDGDMYADAVDFVDRDDSEYGYFSTEESAPLSLAAPPSGERSRSLVRTESGSGRASADVPTKSVHMESSGESVVSTDRIIAESLAAKSSDGGAVKPTRLDAKTSGMKELAEVDIPITGDDLLIEDEPVPEPMPEAGQLTSGEWSDLREWDFWQSVSQSNDWKHMSDHWGMGKGTRISVRVDNGREPIVDARVVLKDKSGKTLWHARSDNHGRAELFSGLDDAGSPPPYEVVVEAHGKTTSLGGIDPRREQSMGESPLVARLDVDAKDPKLVEVVFAIDATGSMGDELNYIKAEITSVIERATEELSEQDVAIRLGANVYRDEGDDYLIRSEKMTDNVSTVADFLAAQYAGGGGDTPEAVEVALEDAIENHDWSDDARSRIVFLVLDAPPHYTVDRLEKIRKLVRSASKKGIRIIGLSGSGVDKETEFLMRYLGIHTGGTYTFLTDHSGIGGSHIEPTIGSHQIEFLDDLLVRLIVQYTYRPESLDAVTPRVPGIR